MKELINPGDVESAILLLAIGGPIAGLIIGALLGFRKRKVFAKTLLGLLIGLTGVLIFGMWRMYNAITDLIGLDRVSNLVLQLFIFAVLGAILGIAAVRIIAVIQRLGAGD